jgi:hypothetical protein
MVKKAQTGLQTCPNCQYRESEDERSKINPREIERKFPNPSGCRIVKKKI